MDEAKLAQAARTLREALKVAEVGKNEHGPFWNTARLVVALRVFYEDTKE